MTKSTSVINMAKHAEGIINQLTRMPGVVGVYVHGGLCTRTETHHQSDSFSDIDITVVVDFTALAEGHVAWHNFKSYQAVGNSWVEVDMYLFDINDPRSWDLTTREGYYSSCELEAGDPKILNKWLYDHTELTPELRTKTISSLMVKAKTALDSAKTAVSEIDKRMLISKAVQLLVETLFYINWKYAPDFKWRVSGHADLKIWKPDDDFTHLLCLCNKTTDKYQLEYTENFFELVKKRISEEGLCEVNTTEEQKNASINFRNKIARLFTRIDKYSDYSVKKCVYRGLPWNAHDLVSIGVENAVDIVFFLNGVTPPEKDKFAKIANLAWQPKNYRQYFHRASEIKGYHNTDDALERAQALRLLFNSIKKKIEEQKLFKTCSLYSENFMEEDLFCEDSPYMIVYKDGSYLNRSQKEETFAEALCKKLSSFSVYERNVVFGMCNHYLLENEQEFLELKESELEEPYVPVWRKAVAELTKKEEI